MLSEPETAVADALEFLVDAHLLESPAPDTYSFHDLLRVYAAERGLAEEPEQAREDSVCRLTDWYLHTAGSADSVVTPWRERVPLGPVQTGIRPLTFATPERALEWFAAERENLVPDPAGGRVRLPRAWPGSCRSPCSAASTCSVTAPSGSTRT